MNYKELYHIMFNAATDAERSIEACNYGKAREILIAAQQKAEEAYLAQSDTQKP